MSNPVFAYNRDTMELERRLETVVVGRGKPGQVRVALGRGERKFVADVPFDMLQPALRMPNSEFVAVISGRDVVRVEPAGRIWLTIQDQIRVILNGDWDPIGVADSVEDEYDMYIAQIHSLLVANSAEQTIADHLLRIERERMGLTGTHMSQLLNVASNLRSIQLPPVENSGSAVGK
jgi:hypothetical protein